MSEEPDSRLLSSSLQANCYTNNGNLNNQSNNLPADLTNVQKLDANTMAMTAAVAANAFLTNHSKLINPFDTLDPKFISGTTSN